MRFPGYVQQRRLLTLGSSATRHPYSSSSTSAASNAAELPNDSDAPVANMANPFQRERRQCILCQMNVQPNYKNVRLLSQFQSQYTGRIYGRHITGLCRQQQERVESEITRAQRAGYMGTYNKSVEFVQDPRLFDPERPLRPHNY